MNGVRSRFLAEKKVGMMADYHINIRLDLLSIINN